MPKKKVEIKGKLESEAKPIDLEKYQSIAVKTGSTKTYKMDHKIIWDKDKDRVLVEAEANDLGQRFVKTNDTNLQSKLEALGYKDGEKIRKIHKKGKNPGITSAAKVQELLK